MMMHLMASRVTNNRSAPSPWIYLVAAPIVYVMATAFANDPSRMGDRSRAADMTLPVFIVIGLVMTSLMVGVWALSRFRYRTPTVLLQVSVVWIGGLLYVLDIRTHVSAWDLAEDGGLLLTALLQLLPGRSPERI